jgi:hypothetical protein
MNAEQLRDVLRQRPFRPFTICMTDGSRYDVRHPELVLLYKSTVVFGDDTESADGIAQRLQMLSLIHIVRLEYLEDATASGRSK